MGVGIDIVLISRLENNDAFARRVLSKDEYNEYVRRGKSAEFLAGRFASKEAFIKAQNFIKNPVPLKDIEVVVSSSGKPALKFNNELYDLSIAHDGDYAIAIVNTKE